jgi:hypothetical protein
MNNDNNNNNNNKELLPFEDAWSKAALTEVPSK